MSLRTEKGVLHRIINEDKRMFIKLQCYEIIAKNVVHPRTKSVDRCNLGYTLRYMKQYHSFIEMQMVGLDVVLDVISSPGGNAVLDSECADFDAYLSQFLHVESMKEKLDLYTAKKQAVIQSAASILNALRMRDCE